MKNKIPILSVYDENGNRLEIPAIVGRSAYQDAVHRGYQGSVDDWLKSLRGEKGDPGENYNLTEADKEEIAGMISGSSTAGNVLILVSGASLDNLRIGFVSPPEGVSVDAAYELIGRGMFDVTVQIYSADDEITGMGFLRGISVGDEAGAIGEFWSDGNVSMVSATLNLEAMTAYAEVMYISSGGTSVEIDDTLAISGAAADAKAVGDKLSEVYETIADLQLGGNAGTLTSIQSVLTDIVTFLKSVPFDDTVASASDLDDIQNKIDALSAGGGTDEPEQPDEPDTPDEPIGTISATFSGGELVISGVTANSATFADGILAIA